MNQVNAWLHLLILWLKAVFIKSQRRLFSIPNQRVGKWRACPPRKAKPIQCLSLQWTLTSVVYFLKMIISSLKFPSVGWTVFHLNMLKYIENKHLYQFRLESSYVGIKVVWNWMSIGVKLIYFFRFQSPLIPLSYKDAFILVMHTFIHKDSNTNIKSLLERIKNQMIICSIWVLKQHFTENYPKTNHIRLPEDVY